MTEMEFRAQVVESLKSINLGLEDGRKQFSSINVKLSSMQRQHAALSVQIDENTALTKRIASETYPFAWIVRMMRRSPEAIANGVTRMSMFSRLMLPIVGLVVALISLFTDAAKPVRDFIMKFLP